MVTTDNETDETVPEKWETSSSYFGLDKQPTDVFESQHFPKPPELEEALAETGLLTEMEARAFVLKKFGTFPLTQDEEIADEIAQTGGFDNADEYRALAERGREKVANAIWIYELIDAFRFAPRIECDECGSSAPVPMVTTGNPYDDNWLCPDCADIDPYELGSQYE